MTTVPNQHTVEVRKLNAPEWANAITPFLKVRIESLTGKGADVLMEVNQGGIFLWRVAVNTIYDFPYDLTNWLIRGKLRDGWTSEDTEKEFYEQLGRVHNYGSDKGYFDLYMTAAETGRIDLENGVFDIEMVLLGLTDIGFGGGYSSAALVKDTGGGIGRVTANGGTPFTGILAGDLVRIWNAENSGNDATYEVGPSPSSTVLSFTKKLGHGKGVDNAADTALLIQKLTPDEDNVIKLLRGQFRLIQEATRDDD